MSIKIGDSASRTTHITDELVRLFAQVSGDDNSVHLDEAAAKESIFGGRIAHGMLSGALISAVLGCELPGAGTIYLSQDLRFKAPVFLEDDITSTVECIKYREDKRIATFKTTCMNQDGKVVVEGEAVVIAPEK